MLSFFRYFLSKQLQLKMFTKNVSYVPKTNRKFYKIPYDKQYECRDF